MKILEFIKWLFGEIFKLNAVKMLMVLLFLAFIVWSYFQYKEIMKEDINIKSVPEKPLQEVTDES